MKVFVVCTMLFAAALAAPGIMDNQVNQETSMSSIFGSCAESADITTCLAVKGITVLSRAARASNLEILPGIAFVR